MSLEERISQIEAALPAAIIAEEVAGWVDVRDAWKAAAKRLTEAAQLIDGLCAETIPMRKGATITSEGRVFARTASCQRTEWDKDDLRRVVNDSVLFDPQTGARLEPQELLLRVFPLGTPRIGALKELGILPSEYCVERWTDTGVKEL